MNYFKLFFYLFFLSFSLQAQIEKIIVENYYISDANDATDTTGGQLQAGSKTYRIYIDLKLGSKIKKIYGDANHTLKFASTTTFFNNKVDGQSFAKDISKSRYGENTVALDTWITLGQTAKLAAQTNFGMLKIYDTDGSFIGGGNNDGGSLPIAAGLISNTNSLVGIPVTTADGMMTIPSASAPTLWADYGFKDLISGDDSTIFGSIITGSQFISHNAGLQNSGTSGVIADSNHVLIAQLTTTGDISFEVNLEVEEFDGTNTTIVNYVANDSVLLSGEVFNSYLKYPPVCGCKDPNYLEYRNTYSCSENDSCKTRIVFGCTDTMACNYDPTANFNLPSLCCYLGYCADRDINVVCPNLKKFMPEFDIYPNPAQGSISLSLTNSNTSVNTTEQTKYAIYNSLGQIVFEKNLGSIPSITETINISNLKTGVYIIRILSGSISINKFFIKN